MKPLRRLVSILIAAVLVLTFVAPLLAYGQVGDSWLPACCRRAGQHHCAMTMGAAGQMAATNDSPVWTPRLKCCPCCPAAVSVGHYHETAAAPPAQAFFAGVASYGIRPAQTEAKRRVSHDRSRQKRGPPVELLPA